MNMKPEALAKFDEVREFVGRSLKIESGTRCEKHNVAVGGEPNSAHCQGYAFDISISNGAERIELVRAMLTKGLVRIGVYKSQMIVHMDVAPSPWPQDVLWVL
jgi:uncharacterized protein YcbK (DUF882 family)